jgi:hypothetical protein
MQTKLARYRRLIAIASQFRGGDLGGPARSGGDAGAP